VNEAIDIGHLAPMSDTQMMDIRCRIPKFLLTNPELDLSLKQLEQEVYEYYVHSLRTGIGKGLLKLKFHFITPRNWRNIIKQLQSMNTSKQ